MNNLVRPIKVEPRAHHRIWLQYDDGVSGEIDLSHLVGSGIFTAWQDPEFFKTVHLTPHRAIAWDNDQIDLCADALYMELTGLSFQEIYPRPEAQRADA